jgi:hypothetical protein
VSFRPEARFARAFALAGLCVALPLHAAEPGAAAAHKPAPTTETRERTQHDDGTPYWLDFSAGRVDIDANSNELDLSDHVVVRVDRYRLTSDRLKLHRGPRGIVVDGSGRVAFCPCPDPPVSIGFSSVTVAPPTDMLIAQPTLRLGGVPVMWLPYLWLRSPDRVGMLPPRVAWRAQDGLLLGSGVHLPFGPKPDHGRRSALDLRAAGYVKGGAELDGNMATPTTSTRVRWDHLRRSLLEIDAHGAVAGPRRGSVAWQLDAIRGARGLEGTILLEPAARRYDRAVLLALRARGAGLFAMGVRTDAARGGPLDRFGAVGPRAHLGFGGALGDVGDIDSGVDVQTVHAAGYGSATLGVQRLEIGMAARPGPLSASVRVRDEFDAGTTDSAGGVLLQSAGRARLGLPLVRAYGSGSAPIVHRVEPFIEGGGGYAASRGAAFAEPELVDGGLVSAVAGLDNVLGSTPDRAAATLGVRGGYVGPAAGPEPAVSGRLGATVGWLALRSDLAWLPRHRRDVIEATRLRLGREDRLHVTGYVEGRSGASPTLARLLVADAFDAPKAGWFDRSGWSTGGELGVPWTDWLASAVAGDYDLETRQLLAIRGSVAYRHPCGCLALVAWAGHRIGRPGVDAWMSVDLAP